MCTSFLPRRCSITFLGRPDCFSLRCHCRFRTQRMVEPVEGATETFLIHANSNKFERVHSTRRNDAALPRHFQDEKSVEKANGAGASLHSQNPFWQLRKGPSSRKIINTRTENLIPLLRSLPRQPHFLSVFSFSLSRNILLPLKPLAILFILFTTFMLSQWPQHKCAHIKNEMWNQQQQQQQHNYERKKERKKTRGGKKLNGSRERKPCREGKK